MASLPENANNLIFIKHNKQYYNITVAVFSFMFYAHRYIIHRFLFIVILFNKSFKWYSAGASPGFGRGGGQNFFWFRFGNLHVAKRHAAHGKAMRFARGVRGHAPPRIFFKIVQFGAFWCIF